jgi:hypothetical protein
MRPFHSFPKRWPLVGLAALVAVFFLGVGKLCHVAAETPAAKADEGKRKAEASTKLLAGSLSTPAENPTVEPGLVQWHATFADAGRAARQSKKPVLLFQMMGKLDDQFC